MLRQVGQVVGNNQNNTWVKSQATVITIVIQATRQQTPNTSINVFVFQMPQYSVKKQLKWMFLKVLQFWAR